MKNVNFQLLLKAHNGDVGRAVQAWDAICSLGGFGNVPPNYEGGLDLQGLRQANDETTQGSYVRANPAHMVPGQSPFLYVAPVAADDVKKIEDIASGDTPQGA